MILVNSCRKPTNGLDTWTNGDGSYSKLLKQLLELYLTTLESLHCFYKTNRIEAELQDNTKNAIIQDIVALLENSCTECKQGALRPVNKHFLSYVIDGEGNGRDADDQVDKDRDEDVQVGKEGNSFTVRDEYVQVDKKGDSFTARDEYVQVDKEGDSLTVRDDSFTVRDEYVQVDKEGDSFTVRDEDVQVDEEGDGLTARDEDVQVDEEGDGLTVRDEYVQVDKEGDGFTVRDEYVQVDEEGDGLTARDEDVQVDEEGNGLTARDEEGDGLTARDEYVQVDEEGDSFTVRDEDVQVDEEGDSFTVRDEDVQVDEEGNGLTARDEDVQVDEEGDGLTARDEDVQVDKEGNSFTVRDEDVQVDDSFTVCDEYVQVDEEGDGLTARDEDVQVDEEGDGLTARDEDDQVDEEGDGLAARDEDNQVDKEADGLTTCDENIQVNKEGNDRDEDDIDVQVDKEGDGLTARGEGIQVGDDDDVQADIEDTNCYQSANNGSTQSNGSDMQSVKVVMTESTIPPSFVPCTISPDDKESTHFSRSKSLAKQRVTEPAVPTPESSFQYGISKETNSRSVSNRQSLILCVVMGLIGLGLLILIHTVFSSQALSNRTNSTNTREVFFTNTSEVFFTNTSEVFFTNTSEVFFTNTRDVSFLSGFISFLSGNFFKKCGCRYTNSTHSYNICFLDDEPKHTKMPPLQVRSYSQEICPVEAPDKLICTADDHTLKHLYQALVCNALNATELMNSSRRLTEMPPLQVRSYSQETCPVEAPDDLICTADDYTLKHLYQALVCNALNATELMNSSRRLTADRLVVTNFVVQTSLVSSANVSSANVSSAFLQATEMPYFRADWSFKDAATTKQLGQTLSLLPPLTRKRKRSNSANDKSASKKKSESCTCMGGKRRTRMCFFITVENLERRTETYSKKRCNWLPSVCKLPVFPIVFVCFFSCISRSSADQGPHKELDETCNSLFYILVVLVHLTLVAVTLLTVMLVVWKLHAAKSKPSPFQRHNCSGATNIMSGNMDDSVSCQPLGNDSPLSKPQHKTVCTESAGREHTLSSEDSVSLFENSSVKEHPPMILAETEPPDLPQRNPNTPFFEHSDDPPYTPDPSQTSEDDDQSGSAPNPISGHSSDYPEADQQQSTITTPKASNADLDSTSHLSPKVSPPPRKSSVVNPEEPNSSEFETSDHFKPPRNRNFTNGIVTLPFSNPIHPTVAVPIPKVQQRVHNSEPHAHGDIQATTTGNDPKPPLLKSDFKQQKSDTFLKPPPPEVDTKKHNKGTTKLSCKQCGEDVVGGSDCVNSHKQAFVKSNDVQGSEENSHAARIDVPVSLTQADNCKHPPDSAFVRNNGRSAENTQPTTLANPPIAYNGLTTSEPGETISKQCVDPPLTRKDALEGGGAQAETSGHTPPVSKPDRLDHSVKLSANDDCGNVLSPLQTVALLDTEQELDHPPLQYVPGVGLAEANTPQTTVASELQTLNNTASPETDLSNEVAPTVTHPTSQLVLQSPSSCSQALMPPLSHSPQPNILPTNNLADDRPPRVARPSCILVQHTPSVSIVPPPCAIIRILTALIHNCSAQAGPLYLPAHASRTLMTSLSHLLHPNILPAANDRPRSQNNPGCILATDSRSISIVPPLCAIIRILIALIHNCSAQAGPLYLLPHASHLPISIKETHIANSTKLLVRRRSYSCRQTLYRRERVVDGGGVSSNCVAKPIPTEETDIANPTKLLVRRRSYSGPQVLYRRERVVDGGGVSSNYVATGCASISMHGTLLVCEETDQSHGQIIVAVGNDEVTLCEPLHGANGQAHFSQNVHTHVHSHSIVGVSHNIGGNFSSFNTLREQQLGEVELAPPPSAEVEGNEHPPPEDSNVVMSKLQTKCA